MHGTFVHPFLPSCQSTAFCSDHGLPFAPLAHMTTAAAIAEAQEASDEVRFWKQTCFVKKINRTYFIIFSYSCPSLCWLGLESLSSLERDASRSTTF